MAGPAFNLRDRVEYRFAADGPFVGEATVIEVLSDGRYRLARLNGTPFAAEVSIFGEAQLRLSTWERSTEKAA